MAQDKDRPIMPRPGASSVTPEQARQNYERKRRAGYKQGKKRKKKEGR